VRHEFPDDEFPGGFPDHALISIQQSAVDLIIIGVASEFQGQGFGGKLLRALIGESEQVGIPIYTETQTEENVRFYEKLGFKDIMMRMNLKLKQ